MQGIQFQIPKGTQLMLSTEPVVRSAKKLKQLPVSLNWCTNQTSPETKKTTPAGKRICLLPCLSWIPDSVLSLEQQSWKKRVFSQLSSYANEKKNEAPDSGQ